MLKPFALLLFLLTVMISAVSLHYALFNDERVTRSMQDIVSLTQMAPLSLSLSYDESTYNRTYPEMQGLGRMDFIYEQ